MKGKKLIIFFLCLILASCMPTPPKPRQIQNSFQIEKPFDAVWTAVIEVFSELSLPIINIEKASGLIVTDWISFDSSKVYSYMDCGDLSALAFNQKTRRGKFNVFVKKTDEKNCEMKINSVFETAVFYSGGVQTFPCVSKGALEAEVYKRVTEKIK
ncbi:MAG: hypothetical protein NTV82_18600 [Candidatus Aminicenantes bacterium]|nr:hypothetical protein [Candidatus Aminicenantes bacterium]